MQRALTPAGGEQESSISIESPPDKFEENYAELRKWADINSPKFLMLTVKREKRAGRLGTALKVSKYLNQQARLR